MKILYKNNQFPVLQNKLYENAQEAFECNTGDILIAENEKTGLIYNYSFDPKLIVYDENYGLISISKKENKTNISAMIKSGYNKIMSKIDIDGK